MIGLTSLTTNGRSLVPPKLNRRRAVLVLTKIDAILAWESSADQERDRRFVDLGRYLCEVRAGQYWRIDNLGSFDEFLERKFPQSRRKAYYLMAIHEHLPRIRKADLQQVGWAKATELAKVARRDGQEFDCATWLHKAREMPKEEFQRAVECHLTGKETEPWEILYFKAYKSQLPVIERALETAALMLGTDKSRSYCLEMICADFLAGANLGGRRCWRTASRSGSPVQTPALSSKTAIPRGSEKSFMTLLRPKRPRLRLDPESYCLLRKSIMQRDHWRCRFLQGTLSCGHG